MTVSDSWMGTYVVVLGFVFLVPAAIAVWRGLRSGSWPATQALVTQTAVDADTEGRPWLEVTYAYDVDGRSFERVERFQVAAARIEAAAHTLRAAPAVEVRYHPANPQVARMRRGVSGNSVVWLVIAIATIAAGAALLIGSEGNA